MSVANLGPLQLSAAIRQLVAAPGFGPANPHLTAAEKADLVAFLKTLTDTTYLHP